MKGRQRLLKYLIHIKELLILVLDVIIKCSKDLKPTKKN